MLDFTLLSPASAIVANNPSSFLSHNAPESVTDAMFTRMCHLPIPPASAVSKLVELGHQAWLDGYQSVRYTHLVAEDIEQVEEGNDLDKLKDEVTREELRRGRCVKQGSKRYSIDWEEH
jgi:hypothetical protein